MRAAISVRDGGPDDLPSVAAIYTHYVLKTTTTFNTAIRTPKQWTDRYDTFVQNGPYHFLVAERDGNVVGFVETQPWRPKPAYDSSIEVTVYTEPTRQRSGVGSALYGALFERLADSDFHRAYAIIALPNEASIAFHERFGFVHRGTLTEVGFKLGRWIDTAIYERALS